jgi:hypothetical protein
MSMSLYQNVGVAASFAQAGFKLSDYNSTVYVRGELEAWVSPRGYHVRNKVTRQTVTYPTLKEFLAAMNPKAKYLVHEFLVAQKVEGGVRVLWNEWNRYAWGEFIADADFVSDDCVEVEYVATDFESTNLFYQRQMTEEVMLEAGL